MIKEVSNYNGDVIKFAGDALQVIWRNRPNEPQESLAELVIRASRCCLAMLAKHSNFKPRTTDGAVLEGIVLKLHMGVGAGRISSFIVGGHGPSLDEKKWEYFIAGEPIQQMSDAAEIATSGELVLSPVAADLMREALPLPATNPAAAALLASATSTVVVAESPFSRYRVLAISRSSAMNAFVGQTSRHLLQFPQ